MNHEFEHKRASSQAEVVNHNYTVDPGKSTRSALLRKPEHAIASGLVQRSFDPEHDLSEVNTGMHPHAVQRDVDNTVGIAADWHSGEDIVDRVVQHRARGSGAFLDAGLRERFEGSLGVDLGGVRVHADAETEGARAFAYGQDLHFASGQYAPQTIEGQYLIAHEVAHTVQQQGAAPAPRFTFEISQPGDAAEVEADALANTMVAGTPAGPVTRAPMQRIARAHDDMTPAAGRLPFPGVDIVLEQIAHRYVYMNSLDETAQVTLRGWGYTPVAPIHLVGDLQLMTLRPLAGETRVAPVLAFRGSAEFADWIEDMNTYGVGMFQFFQNEPVILDKLAYLRAAGPVTVTGHSLGGALAQITAAMHPDLVAQVVTFQAPGINPALIERMRQPEAARSLERHTRHHVVDGCTVSPAGGRHTSGSVIRHHWHEEPHRAGISELAGSGGLANPLAMERIYTAHTIMPLAEEAVAAGALPEGGGFTETRGAFDAPTASTEDPGITAIEIGRHGLGAPLADHTEEAWVASWLVIRTQAESGAILYRALTAQIACAEAALPDGNMQRNLDELFPELRVASTLEDRVRIGELDPEGFVTIVGAQVSLDAARRARLARYHVTICREARLADQIDRATGPIAVQRRGEGALPANPHAIAARGAIGGGSTLPFTDVIQASFGRHDVASVRAHQGEEASQAAKQLGARAYAYGNDIVFDGAPDLHTTAHEVAHVVQQRAGIHLAGGIGTIGDTHEQHADAVANRVLHGESAEALLDWYAPAGGTMAIQRIPDPVDAPGVPGLAGVRQFDLPTSTWNFWWGTIEAGFSLSARVEALHDEHERIEVRDRGERGVEVAESSEGRLRDLIVPDCEEIRDRIGFSIERGRMRGQVGVATRTHHLGPVDFGFQFDLIEVDARTGQPPQVRFATLTANVSSTAEPGGPLSGGWRATFRLRPNYTALAERALPYVLESGEPSIAATEAAIAEGGATGAVAGASAAIGISLLWMGFVLNEMRESAEEGHSLGLQTWYINSYAQLAAARIFEYVEAPQYYDPSEAFDYRGTLHAQRRGRQDARTMVASLPEAKRAAFRAQYHTRERLAEAIAAHVAQQLGVPYDASAER